MTAATPESPEVSNSEDEFDVLVVGSGAAGMTAALAAAHRGLRAVVVDKSDHFGGSTARSGGGVWIPNNSVLQQARVTDSAQNARDYLEHIVGDTVPAQRREAFLDNGPGMLDEILAHTPLRLRWVTDYSDYYPEAPGGRARGRSVEPVPLNGKVLGAELQRLEPDYGKAPLNVVVTQVDFRWLNLMLRHPRGPARVLRVGLRWLWSLITRKHLLGRGQALMAGLRAGLARAGVPVWLESPLVELTRDDSDRVTGAVLHRNGADVHVRARRGVVLASGGFERNETMRKQHQREPTDTRWTVGAKANTGDGIVAGQKLGGAVDLMDDAWWGPSIPLNRETWFCLAERTLPGCLMVNGAGERFANEAAPYVDAVHAMYGSGDGPAKNMPTWLICDQRYRNRYVFAGLGPRQPFPGRWLKSGIVHRASTVDELARSIEVDPESLQNTVQRFNGFARTGVDEDFHRGESAYDHYYGDPRNRPNPSLRELTTPPFYAVRIVPGDLGTKGGLRTDTSARVLRADGSVIPGLYAAGNASAAVMGHTYAGPGATIGPAMTFGYLAAVHMTDSGTNSEPAEHTTMEGNK